MNNKSYKIQQKLNDNNVKNNKFSDNKTTL